LDPEWEVKGPISQKRRLKSEVKDFSRTSFRIKLGHWHLPKTCDATEHQKQRIFQEHQARDVVTESRCSGSLGSEDRDVCIGFEPPGNCQPCPEVRCPSESPA
ncbi:hypothetical protein STEG23_021025, partial [Scotinomys teguina]